MKFGLFLPTIGTFANPHAVVEIAQNAEEHGWDGVFVWDVLTSALARDEPPDVVDPLVVLAAIGAATERIKLGPMVTPLARRRPHKVARELATLDHLSRGRVIFGVGLGDTPDDEFARFGEETDARVRADRLDEGLEAITQLWAGRPVTFEGEHVTVRGATFLPTPIQQPRIPIWAAGHWPRKKPARRAAQWDGMFPLGSGTLTPENYREIGAYILKYRRNSTLPDLVMGAMGNMMSPTLATVAAYEAAGVTWWLEMFLPQDGIDGALRRAEQRPLG
jgi:alkanesulfonate monooxygenase SsuD/methylene tetrahydromethanopterin reductase-like flavin-dependent oxidoreductase (luciferase family)